MAHDLRAREAALIEELMAIPDRQERLTYIMDRIRERPALPAEARIAAHRVSGCVSAVWLVAHYDGCCWHVQSDAESPMVRGLVALLSDVADGSSRSELAVFDVGVLERSGVLSSLSGTRIQGLRAVAHTLRQYGQSPTLPPAQG